MGKIRNYLFDMNRAGQVFVGALVAIAVTGGGYVFHDNYINDPRQATPIVYSENSMLYELWRDYKINNIEPGTNRTLDKQQSNITTSEGQSYTMLRSVWMDDKDMFDKSWKWTKDNLQRDDKLHSWKFGQLPDGSYGVQANVGGQNTATDGDTDIALALLMAYMRWNESSYLFDAKPIISAVWEKSVVTINGKPILVSNDLERNNQEKVIVNPSYFSPYAYRVFAKVDPTHNWTAVVDSSYDVLRSVSDLKLDKASSSGLPPDWITINRKTGEISRADQPSLTTNYGYDAIRVPFRLAMDWKWFQEERAREVLSRYSFLNTEWTKNNKLSAGYTHDGQISENYESVATYGASLPYFTVIQPKAAKEIYDRKLKILYTPDEQRWKTPQAYYDDNWAWFGMAFMEDALPNLTGVK